MSSGATYITEADEAVSSTYEEPISLTKYVDKVLQDSDMAAHASKYLLNAIEASGTREVIEEGEPEDRYIFFDDPYNDGEHAVLGNTVVLNEFVDDLRAIAAQRGKEEKITWIDGPTATGKSEFKRCLINGLREYSKTADGKRYTIEWNLTNTGTGRGLSYGDKYDDSEDHWYESPVQTHPLSVFPEDVRDDLLDELNKATDGIDVIVDSDLDPFSREAYDILQERYRKNGDEDIFSAITDEKHLRVKNYVVDLGNGIGVLHSEDDGSPKERLVGSWMRGMLQELNSRGRKNPQAFSYDGVVSQGNNLLTVVEDASQHTDLLQRLLNVPDENTVKLDKSISMDVDTQMVVISNPDLAATLDQHADKDTEDPLKALKRRLEKHEFTYLTGLSLEVELLHREFLNSTGIGDYGSEDEYWEHIREPAVVTTNTADGAVEKEFAPHTLEAAAMYDIVSRLDGDDLPGRLDLTEKALLFDRGYIQRGDTRIESDEFSFDDDASDGEFGIPVTYTRDTLAEMVSEEMENPPIDGDEKHVILPHHVIEQMADGLSDAPVFSTGEQKKFENRASAVKKYIQEQQEKDVLDAMTRDWEVSDEEIEAYVDHVSAWKDDDTVTDENGNERDPDPLKMHVFETEKLGKFDSSDYDAPEKPKDVVRKFRAEHVQDAVRRYAWEHNGIDTEDYGELDVFQPDIDEWDWEDVQRRHEDLNPSQWSNPPEDSDTELVKGKTLENMVDMFDYSETSAELTSRRVMGQTVTKKWD